ncbi:hypothetical protein [Sphingomonas sp. 37zxx]|uniref:hypothetical protein n=1 Tax=Sphingomonas sp. 37zxx TaxID=1550073 RepID=UPI00053BF7FF|nr:hypothetical protein [Sphingomonas sp. 37zxx]
MIAGLIFATEPAEDRGEALAATLPFGGMTLLEYQARLLIAAGASHMMVAVARVTPALLGAVNRITRRGVAVDIVRSAEEAAARAHPLASIIVIADSLVTTEPAVRAIAGAQPDTLMVTTDSATPAAVERVDAEHVWAGLASLTSARLAEIAAMPRDYDFQSALLRVSVQGGAAQLMLPGSAKRAGHGVVRHPAQLASRSNAVLAALANSRVDWPDRFVFTPISRLALPQMVTRGVPGWAVIAAAALIVTGGIAAILYGYVTAGLVAIVVAIALLSTGSLLSWLRGDDSRARLQEIAIAAAAGTGALLTGLATSWAEGNATALTLALGLFVAVAIAERTMVRGPLWWGSPSAYLLLLVPFVLAGFATIGLVVAVLYAFATLAAAVEVLRQKA